MFKVCYNVVRNREEAEDLAQETFIKMVDALPSYQSQGFKTWLSRIAFHKAIDFKRKRQRQKEELTIFEDDINFGQGTSAEEDLMQKERIMHVKQSIQQMPKKLQAAVHYYYLEGLTYSEVAKKLEIEEKTVEMRLYRARKWMKANWKEGDFL